jgi:hypothetical protein
MRTCTSKSLLSALILLAAASTALGATATSSFSNFTYSYTVTPAAGEALRSFHVYTALSECDASHYYNRVMPAGWMFDTVAMADRCVITFWTEGDALPVGQAASFGFVHYCAPCCHSWFLSDEGSSDPLANVVDDDENHSEPCNIPAEFSGMCGGEGLLLAPIYPVGVPADAETWSGVKAFYR